MRRWVVMAALLLAMGAAIPARAQVQEQGYLRARSIPMAALDRDRPQAVPLGAFAGRGRHLAPHPCVIRVQACPDIRRTFWY
jgi:hypothetical protein